MQAGALFFLVVGPLLLLSGCDRPPARVDPGAAASAGPDQAAAQAAAPSTHQPPYRGVVVLSGDLASAGRPAKLYVNVKARGQSLPLLIKPFDLSDAALPAAVEGQRRIEFELTAGDTMNQVPLSAPLSGDLDIEAMFDPTGGLTDKSALIRDRRPLEAGPLELSLAR
jgi:hypothetical protein